MIHRPKDFDGLPAACSPVFVRGRLHLGPKPELGLSVINYHKALPIKGILDYFIIPYQIVTNVIMFSILFRNKMVCVWSGS